MCFKKKGIISFYYKNDLLKNGKTSESRRRENCSV